VPEHTRTIAPRPDSEIWADIRASLRNSNCVKTKTAAAVVKDGVIISMGNNLCSPNGYQYGDVLQICPRMEIKTGQNYELCSPIHAEVMASLHIRRDRPQTELAEFAGHLVASEERIRAAFTEEELVQLRGAQLYLVGHYWACDGCVRFLSVVGIPKENIRFDKITAEATQAAYEKKGIQ
jgi:hypothetical protein